MQSPTHAACGVCCAFLRRPNSLSRLGYQPLPPADASPAEPPVRVVVGKERRVFFVDRLVLERDHFRILMEAAGDRIQRRKGAVLVDLDAILFEHLLWLVYHESSSSSSVSFLQLNLKEIIDFYSQDY
ncbi:auxin-responsive protein SAUR77-like [Zingiber officinale]|uniref:auxin-responsive protein SAUR77-like n=1 Tax=Zingiber officinale TaxID=94328 RepID=UPI001C4BDBA7|nr:auxin-responsive protein SAUR77-like [Zingiber officinale]